MRSCGAPDGRGAARSSRSARIARRGLGALSSTLVPSSDNPDTSAVQSDRPGDRTIVGVVIAGDKRGRLLGFPTANVEIPREHADLEFGVYCGLVDGRPAAISIGVRPTFGAGNSPLLEAHILDFEGDLYGEVIHVRLVERLRGEKAFESVSALVDAMHDDVSAVRRITGAGPADA